MRAGLRKPDRHRRRAQRTPRDGRKGWRVRIGRIGAGALTALYGAPPARADRVLASIPTRQSVWPDNGSQRLGRIIGQFDPDALLKPVFDYASRALQVVPFDFLARCGWLLVVVRIAVGGIAEDRHLLGCHARKRSIPTGRRVLREDERLCGAVFLCCRTACCGTVVYRVSC